MPAHTRPLPNRKCSCGKKATVEVRNTNNALMGYACTPCGKRWVKELNEKLKD